jgi:hypothetical protein
MWLYSWFSSVNSDNVGMLLLCYGRWQSTNIEQENGNKVPLTNTRVQNVLKWGGQRLNCKNIDVVLDCEQLRLLEIKVVRNACWNQKL